MPMLMPTDEASLTKLRALLRLPGRLRPGTKADRARLALRVGAVVFVPGLQDESILVSVRPVRVQATRHVQAYSHPEPEGR